LNAWKQVILSVFIYLILFKGEREGLGSCGENKNEISIDREWIDFFKNYKFMNI
jgi:hypothetical protein